MLNGQIQQRQFFQFYAAQKNLARSIRLLCPSQQEIERNV